LTATAGKVTVKRSDGTLEVTPAYDFRKLQQIVRRARGRRLCLRDEPLEDAE
jgi:hypothetical protein